MDYEGIRRPVDIMRVLDGPSSKGLKKRPSESERKILQDYFNDLYTVFLKKFTNFASEFDVSIDNDLKLLAMLQEMIKVKKLLARKEEIV